MGKYSDSLLSPVIKDEPDQTKQKISWSDQILKSGIQPDFAGSVPTGSVLTKEFMGEQTEAPSMLTHAFSGIFDNPENKIKVYAAARFPNEPEEERINRYGIHKGEIVYQGDDGKLYRETPDTWFQKVKKFAGETGAHFPSIILATLGSALGPGGAAVGAATGEIIRQGVGEILGEPETKTGYAVSSAVEGATGFAGDVGGRLLTRGINRVGALRGGKLAAEAGRLRGTIDLDKARQIRKIGEEYGMDLPSPVTTGSAELAEKYNYLGDLDITGDAIKANRLRLMGQMDDAIRGKFAGKISQSRKSPSVIARDIVQAAKNAVEKPVKIRQGKASPIYKEAMAENPAVDIAPVVSFIDDKLTTAKGPVREGLLKAKKMLMKPDLPKTTPASKLVDVSGKPLIPKTSSYDTTLKGLHDAKMGIDELISSAKQSGAGNTVKKNYRDIQTALLGQMDKASKKYARARKIFSEYSEEVDKQKIKSVIGEIANLKGDQQVLAINKIFNSPVMKTKAGPEIMEKIGRQVRETNEDAWNAGVRDFILQTYDEYATPATDDIANIGGMFRKRIFGSPHKQRLIKAALKDRPEVYTSIENFMEVLERTGTIMRKESKTATRLAMGERIGKEGIIGKVIRAQTMPLYTKKRIIGDWLRMLITAKGRDRTLTKVMEALTNEDAIKQLEKMVQLPAKSQVLIPQLTTFLSMVYSGGFGDDETYYSKSSRIPAVLKEQYKRQGRLKKAQ